MNRSGYHIRQREHIAALSRRTEERRHERIMRAESVIADYQRAHREFFGPTSTQPQITYDPGSSWYTLQALWPTKMREQVLTDAARSLYAMAHERELGE